MKEDTLEETHGISGASRVSATAICIVPVLADCLAPEGSDSFSLDSRGSSSLACPLTAPHMLPNALPEPWLALIMPVCSDPYLIGHSVPPLDHLGANHPQMSHVLSLPLIFSPLNFLSFQNLLPFVHNSI